MTDMIPHHHQALEMAALVEDRTNRQELLDVAGRINASQGDEIDFMQKWLADRGEPVPDPTDHAAMHTHHTMAGMASPEQMEELAGADGTEFDKLFLTLMIRHHDGAVKMVEELMELPGSAYDPVLFEFTNDVTNDQTTEIERMNALLVGLSPDPRAGLAAGFDDAGEALLNMKVVASLPRATGFFDPKNPADLPAKRVFPDTEEPSGEKEDKKAKQPEEADGDEAAEEESSDDDGRWPMMSFSNTDMAFSGDVLVTGSYHGFNIYQLRDEGAPQLISSIAARVMFQSSVTC